MQNNCNEILLHRSILQYYHIADVNIADVNIADVNIAIFYIAYVNIAIFKYCSTSTHAKQHSNNMKYINITSTHA